MSKNPAKSRPLSANVMRLMKLSRSMPQDKSVIKEGKTYSVADLTYARRQGELFMEAAFMGLSMEEFVPRYMTSQLAGVFDKVAMGSQNLEDLLKTTLLIDNPEMTIAMLYWIDEIVEKAEAGENKSLLVSKAFDKDVIHLPALLKQLPPDPNRNEDDLCYAYWLGYIYRCECMMHEESSRMVYGAFDEAVMRREYEDLMNSPYASRDLADSSADICERLDRLLVEELWPRELKRRNIRQKEEMQREENPDGRKTVMETAKQ